MKKSSKIFMLILLTMAVSLATVIGAFASTAVEGVTVKCDEAFDYYAGMSGSALDGKNTTIGKVSFVYKDRVGKTEVVSSYPYSDNAYVIYTQTDKTGSSISTPYAYRTVGSYPTKDDYGKGANDLSNFSYLALDIDVMAPSGKIVSGSAIALSARRLTTSGSVDFWNNSALEMIKFGNDATKGPYLYINGNSSNKKYIDPYEFTHISCIVEISTTSTAYNLKTHVYIDGEYFGTKTGSTSTTSYYNNTVHASLYEYRINFTTADAPTETFAMDNVYFRTFSKDYNGNLKSVLAAKNTLDAWESNLYDKDTMPAGYMEAINETKNTYYRNAADAISAASEGDVVSIIADQAEAVTVDKTITVKTIKVDGTAASVTFSAADGYRIYEKMANVWTAEKSDIKVYTYTSGGVEKTAGRDAVFSDIITSADSGSTVYIHEDVYINSTAAISINKNLTIDLGGKTAYVSTAYKTYFMQLNGSRSLTLKNGTLVAEYGKDVARPGKSYVLFSLSSSSKLNLENVNTYTGQLAWNFSANNPQVNIVGGEHHIEIPATDVIRGFVESRANITFNATDATFYCGSSGGGLLTSVHYRASTTTKKSTFTYNNCTIIAPSIQSNIITYTNEFTDIIFNDCDIYGSITPSLYSLDLEKGFKAAERGNIVFGENTRVCENSEFSSAVDLGASCGLVSINEAEKYNLKFGTGSLGNSNFEFVDKEKTVVFSSKISKVDYYTVTWYKEDCKTVIKTEKIAVGASATPPEYYYDTPNVWYSAEYSGWSDTPTGAAVSSFKINRDTSFYPAIVEGSVVPRISGARYNLSLVGAIGVNFYLPMTTDGVSVVGVYGDDGKEIFPVRMYTSKEKLDLYTLGTVGATKLSDSLGVTVKYSVNNTEYTQSMTLSPYNYAISVLSDGDDGRFAYHSSAYTLVYDMIRYSNNLVKYVNYTSSGVATDDTALKSLLDKYSVFETALPDDFSDVSAVDTSTIASYLSYITFDVSQYQPSYKIGFKNGSEVVECYITMNGYRPGGFSGSNSGEVTYKSSDEVFFSGTEHLSSAYIKNIPMYNADNTVTITLLLDSGKRVSGTYNLNAYYTNVSVANATAKNLLENFLKSFRAFSDSAEKYRYASIVITEENAVNFTNCDHTGAVKTTLAITDRVIPVTAPAYYCSLCGSHLIYYSDFGVVGDGVSHGLDGGEGTNDFVALREVHTRANAIQAAYPEYSIVVVGKGTVGQNFYVGAPDDGGTKPIYIKTNVDWDGAHFIIDDTTVTNKIKNSGYDQSIFQLPPDASVPSFTITSKIPNGIAAGATNIGYAPGEPLMLSIQLKSVRHYIRYGGNVNAGGSQSEMIIVDAYGNVDPTTPVQWDYTNEDFCSIIEEYRNASSMTAIKCPTTDADGNGVCDKCSKTITKAFDATAIRISDRPILISGLDNEGNINCTWENISNSNVDVSSYDQFKRNIRVSRSNATVQGMDRVFVEDNSSYTPCQTYAGFVQVENAYNTTIKDMLVQHHLGHNIWKDGVDTGVSLGSYEFSGGSSINTSWINCKAKNFFKPGGLVSYRGLFGTNRLRNSYLKNCVLPSFDSHTAAYNVTIEDSTFEHINYIGAGTVIMKNVAVYVNGGNAACILRSDYGSTWDGDIKIDGLYLRHPSNYAKDNVDLVRAHYTNHYFGYTSHIPGKIYANNVSIQEYDRNTDVYTDVNGIIVETNIKKSSLPLGIYSTLNGALKNDYDYSTVNENNLDPKVCTKAVYISNSDISIAYPDHWFFSKMKVYIDGVEQDWFKVREGLHKDSDGNGVCDNGCGQPLK